MSIGTHTCAVVALLFLLAVTLDAFARSVRKTKRRGPRNISRMPWVNHAGLRNCQARKMGINPRGHR